MILVAKPRAYSNAATIGKLDGISNEVSNDLANFLRVADKCSADSVAGNKIELQAFSLGGLALQIANLVDKRD